MSGCRWVQGFVQCRVMSTAGLTRRQMAFDAGLAGALLLIAFVGSSHVEVEAGERAVDAGTYVLAAIGASSILLWRRAAPLMVLIVAATLLTYLGLGYPPGPALLPGPVSLVLLGVSSSRKVAFTGAAVMAASITIGNLIGESHGAWLALAAIGWSLATVMAGQLIASRRERVHAERAQRELTERQALTDERLRIAQDLHDSVAHAIATINVQSGTAAHLLARQPDKIDRQQLLAALQAIRGASAEVLDELGAILGVLRREEADADIGWLRQPQFGLERVTGLVERARADGLVIDLNIGVVGTIPTLVSQTAYRVVQEALSNVRQHAGRDASVSVSLVKQDGRLVVAVVDDGGQPGSGGGEATSVTGGYGLVGMRERVESTGGTLLTGSIPGGGYQVRASWPS